MTSPAVELPLPRRAPLKRWQRRALVGISLVGLAVAAVVVIDMLGELTAFAEHQPGVLREVQKQTSRYVVPTHHFEGY